MLKNVAPLDAIRWTVHASSVKVTTMDAIATTSPGARAVRASYGTFSSETAQEELERTRVELRANAERLARLTRHERDTLRRRVLIAVPHELAPDVHEEFAFAEEMAAHAAPRVPASQRVRASAAASATPVESRAERPPARLAQDQQDVNLGALITAVLDEHARLVASRMRAELERVAAPKVYTTNKCGPHIPGKSKRWMLEHIKSMPGALNIGRDWTISHTDYEAWATAEDARRCKLAAQKKPSLVTTVPALTKARNAASHDEDDEAELLRRAESSLRAQGFRRSR